MMGKSQLGKAAGQVTKCGQAVARWEADAAAKRAELADLEARMGDEVLDDETAAERLAEQAARLRAAIDVADRTAAAAGRNLIEARRAVLKARAAELRAEAARIREEATQRQAKTDQLLAELSEWEGGCRYVPWEPPPGQGIAEPMSYKIPKTRAMLSRADVLDQRAADLEGKAEGNPQTIEHNAARVLAAANT
jgi:hypothetical protein